MKTEKVLAERREEVDALRSILYEAHIRGDWEYYAAWLIGQNVVTVPDPSRANLGLPPL